MIEALRATKSGRRPQDSSNPEPFLLEEDCPRCGVYGLHLLGKIFTFPRHRVIVRDCAGCEGRWWERL